MSLPGDTTMLKLTVAMLAVVLAGSASAAGWRSLRIDGSSEASFESSVAAIKEKLTPGRRWVFTMALQDIWAQEAQKAGADQSEYPKADYLRQLDGLGYDEVITFTDPTGETARRYRAAYNPVLAGDRSPYAGGASSLSLNPLWASSGPPPVENGVYRGATRSIDHQQH
jgi:hypothetical protein